MRRQKRIHFVDSSPKTCRRDGPKRRCPYRARAALLSRGELAFYRVLLVAVRDRWGITIKPRLADVIFCPPALWRCAAGARVAQKHLDFVLYDRLTTAVVLAIELDDRSHRREARRARDAFVEHALASCRVRLLRVKAARGYDAGELRHALAAHVLSTPDAIRARGEERA